MIVVRRLGITDYEDALARMRSHVAARGGGGAATADELWLTEHPAVFTLGFASRREHLRETGKIPVIATERGGQVTYHGPGQVVAYLLLDLRRRKLGVRDLVCRLEEGIIHCLEGYGVKAVRKPAAPGIYVQARTPTAGLPAASSQAHGLAKIASIGLKVSRGFTWHGVALNGCMDLEPFERIDPCGFAGLQMTDVCTAAGPARVVNLNPLADRLAAALVNAIEG